MQTLNILLVSQYFPPYNTPRAFRTFELAKQLAKQGHNITVYSLLGDYDYKSIETKYNIKIKSFGPSKLGNADSVGHWNKNFIYRCLSHLIMNFEFPSIELSFLIKNNIRHIHTYDIVISIAYPFSIHWGIGLLKPKIGKFPLWISDCGDPFMGNPFTKHPFIFKYIEKWWCRKTDNITVPIESAKDAYYSEFRDKISVIPQGFDFSEFHIEPYIKNKIPTFIYAGTVYPKTRDPRSFLKYLSTLNFNFKFIVYTNAPNIFKEYSDCLKSKLIIYEYIPREELLKELSKADFLINLKNEGDVQSPSKLIDYTLANRPILEITSDFNESDILIDFFNNNFSKTMKKIDISKFNIKNIANSFLEIYYNKIKNV